MTSSQQVVVGTAPVQNAPGAVIQTTSPGVALRDDQYNVQQSKALGIVEVVAGCLCVLFNVIALAVPAVVRYYQVPGIWCAVFFILGGSFGIVAAGNRNRSHIDASLGLNITASIFAFILFVWCCVGVAGDNVILAFGITYNGIQANMAMGALMLVMSIVVFITSTWLYVLACKSRRGITTTTTTITTTHNQAYMGQPPQPYVGQPPQPYMGQPQQPYVGQPPQPYVGQPQGQNNPGFQPAPLTTAPQQYPPTY